MKLEKIEKLCDAATAEPWGWTQGFLHDTENGVAENIDPAREQRNLYGNLKGKAKCIVSSGDGEYETPNFADAKFITASRTLLPKLLAAAYILESIVSSFESLEKQNGKFSFDFTPLMRGGRETLAELEKE